MSRRPLPPLPRRYRVAAWIRPGLPFVAWGLLAIAAWSLYQRVQVKSLVPGFAQSLVQRVGSEQGGRLYRLEVRLHEAVTSGQILARLVNPALRLDLQSARSRLQESRYRLDLEAQRWRYRESSRQLDGSTLSWRIRRDRYLTEIEELRERTSQAEDRARLAGIAIELERIEGLEKESIASASQLNQLRTDHDALERRIDNRLPLLQSLASHRKRALRDFESQAATSEISSTNKQLQHAKSLMRLQELEIQKVELALASLELRSSREGLVSRILKVPGELVQPGEAVLEILDRTAHSIEAWVPEAQIRNLEIGGRVRVYRKADPQKFFASRVLDIGESIRALPERLGTGQLPPPYGLPVRIAIPDSMSVRAGELFHIAID